MESGSDLKTGYTYQSTVGLGRVGANKDGTLRQLFPVLPMHQKYAVV
jgi:hypothetical protein